MKHLYDQGAETRQFCEGDQVLAFLPIVGSPLQAKFVGPHTVVRKLSEQNYLNATPKETPTLSHKRAQTNIMPVHRLSLICLLPQRCVLFWLLVQWGVQHLEGGKMWQHLIIPYC